MCRDKSSNFLKIWVIHFIQKRERLFANVRRVSVLGFYRRHLGTYESCNWDAGSWSGDSNKSLLLPLSSFTTSLWTATDSDSNEELISERPIFPFSSPSLSFSLLFFYFYIPRKEMISLENNQKISFCYLPARVFGLKKKELFALGENISFSERVFWARKKWLHID